MRRCKRGRGRPEALHSKMSLVEEERAGIDSGRGSLRRRWSETELYEVVLSDAFVNPSIPERDAHEQKEMISGFLARCWEIRREYSQRAAQASRPGRHLDTSLGTNPSVRDFFRGVSASCRQDAGQGGSEERGTGPRGPSANSHTRPRAHNAQQPFNPGAPVPISAFGPAIHAGSEGESPEPTIHVGPGGGLRGGLRGSQTSRQRSLISMSEIAAHGDNANA